MTLDVEEYPAWAGQFVPRDYTKTMIKCKNHINHRVNW